MAFNPEDFGAKCSTCPLRDSRVGGPVPTELNNGAKIIIVGDYPSKDECQNGRPFIGPAGAEIMQALSGTGLTRKNITWANAVACRPKDDRMDRVLHILQKSNKENERECSKLDIPFAPIQSPALCCRPMLISTFKQNNFSNVIAAGGTGFRALTNSTNPISKIRGGPYIGDMLDDGSFLKLEQDDTPSIFGGLRLRILPTYHPSYVTKKRRWTKVFRADIARAIRWFNGRLGWTEPQTILYPTVEQLEQFLLKDRYPFWTCDVETEYYDRRLSPALIPLPDTQLMARLYCIGFGTPDRAISVPFLGIDAQTTFYDEGTLAEFRRIICTFLTDPTRYKVGHNFGYFDRNVIRRVFGVDPNPVIDTILLHRLVDSELPHSLAFVGSYYTDVTAWKSDSSGTEARTDDELLQYNCIDNVVDARIMEPLVSLVQMRDQTRCSEVDHKIQHYCADMHTIGMYVDQEIRQKQDRKLFDGCDLQGRPLFEYICDNKSIITTSLEDATSQFTKKLKEGDTLGKIKAEPIKGAVQHKKAFQDACGYAINPGSYPQIRELLYEKWDLEPKEFTELGEPGTGDDVLREIMSRNSLKPYQKTALESLRWYRRYVKYRGTYTSKFKLCTEFIKDDGFQEDEDRNKEEDKFSTKRRGVTLLDGRAHAGWNAHSTVSGRLSSSQPFNAQNVPIILRDMFVPENGNVFIYADKDQVELRLVAALSGSARYLEVFERAYKLRGTAKQDKFDTTLDPHSATAQMIFPEEWAVSSNEAKARIRDYSKRFSYAVIYGATPDTIHDVIVSTEDNKGRLIYAGYKKTATVSKIHKWLAANPEIAVWWETVNEEARQQGFLVEPILGRRRDFLDGTDEEHRSEIINFKPQAASSAAVGLSTIQLIEGPLPFGKWGPNTGLINQCHDALLFEVPKRVAKEMREEVERCMTQRFACLPVWLTAEAKIVTDWTGKKWDGT
jgi:DNA polymerase I-like protein with 3'-5' exonuclease and polymerase domains/uracil-DNA glycosylase